MRHDLHPDGVPGAVTGRPPLARPGVLIRITVDEITTTLDTFTAHGGTIARPVGADFTEITARFRDPAGDVRGLSQERG